MSGDPRVSFQKFDNGIVSVPSDSVSYELDSSGSIVSDPPGHRPFYLSYTSVTPALLRVILREDVRTINWFTGLRKPIVGYQRKNTAPTLTAPRKPTLKRTNFKTRPRPLKPARWVHPYRAEKTSNPSKKYQESLRYRLLEQKVNSAIDRKFDRKLQNWFAFEDRRLAKIRRQDAANNRRWLKYEAAMRKFYERRAKLANWQSRSKLVKMRDVRQLQEDNPLLYIDLLGLGGSLVLATYYTRKPEIDGMGHRLCRAQKHQPLSSSEVVKLANSRLLELLQKEKESLKAKLSHKFYDKTAAQQVHLATVVAERAQTLNMLSNSIERLTSFLKSKKSLFKSTLSYVQNPKAISNDFLAFKFGLEPLVSDVKGLAAELAAAQYEGDMLVVIRTNERTPLSFTREGVKFSGYYEASYVVKYSVEPGYARALQTLGLLNVSEVLWESMPWSFVVDWVLPVGKYLTQLSADSGLSFVTGTYSERIVATIDSNASIHPPPIPNEVLNSAGTFVGTYQVDGRFAWKYKSREVLTEPPPRLKLHVKNPLSWTHGFEALALAVQKLKA